MRRRLVPARIRRSYAAKYAVGFVIVLLVVGAIGGGIYLQTESALASATRSKLQTESALQGDVVSQWVGQLKSDAKAMSLADAVAGNSMYTRQPYFRKKLEDGSLEKGVVAIHYVADGKATTLQPDTSPELTPEGDTPWGAIDVGRLAPATPQVTRPYLSPVTGQPAIAVVSRIATSDGTPKAVVLVVDLDTAVTNLRRPNQQTSTVVVDDQGTVVMSHHTEDILAQNMGPQNEKTVDSMAVKKGLAGETGYMDMTMHGQDVAMGYAPVAGTNWVVMTHEPRSAAFALTRDVSTGLLLLLGSMVVGLGLIGLTLGKGTIDSLNTLAARAGELEAGDLDADLETDREDEIGGLFSAFDSMRVSLGETIEDAESARARAVSERERSEQLVHHLEEKAGAYRNTMQALADGDLTQRMDPESQSDAMRDIGEAFNAMAAELEATVGSVKRFSETVATATESVTASAEEVKSAGEDVSVAVQEISDGAEDQARSLTEVSGELEGLSATIEEIAASAQEVAATSRQTAARGQDGRSAAEDAIEGMNRIEERAEETATAVERMNDEMAEMREVVELIDGIAGQTTTLALNASIEAARAGEAGQGFAVVAEEVKRLAEETRKATTQIADRIDQLGARSEQSASDVRRMREGIATGTGAVEEAASALSEIVDAVERTNSGVQDIDDATDEQATSTQEVVAMVQTVSATGEQVNQESETVAAAAEEQAASLSEVTQHATRLTERAAELDDLLSAFTVEEAAIDADGQPTPAGGEWSLADGGEPTRAVDGRNVEEDRDWTLADADEPTRDAGDGRWRLTGGGASDGDG